MIIRSQDKESIWNFNNVDCIHISVDNVGCYIKVYVNDNSISIGHYSTDEKAIKVLDMIQEAYCGMRSVDCTTRGMLDTFAKREDVSCLLDLHIDKYFFQMPKDSEV